MNFPGYVNIHVGHAMFYEHFNLSQVKEPKKGS